MSATEMLEEAKVVEDALKTLGEPVRLKDLVELTKDRVRWRSQKNRSAQIQSFMSQYPAIRKAGFGLYTYDCPNDEADNNLKKNKSDEVLEVSEKDKDLLDNFRRDTATIFTKKSYKVGDDVEGKVTGIEDYGAFLEGDNGDMQGLVHITNISKGITDDVSRHFAIGDTVRAKVVAVRSGGKLSLSTKESQLPDYFRSEEMEGKLKHVSDKIRTGVFSPPRNDVEKSEEEEYKEVYKFIQGITGVVSNRAKEKIKMIIEQDGMFKFTMALSEAKELFEIDASMMLVKEIEKKLNDGL